MGDEKKREGAGMSRRTFALGVGGAGVLLAMGGLKLVPAEAQVRPPGGQDESRLVASCIRCERCVEACPRGALRPAHIEDGIVSVRTPTTNFNDGWCDFCADENDGVPLCVAACPTEALALPAGATAENTLLGLAVIDEAQCLAFRDTGCRYCYDACPYEAIELTGEGAKIDGFLGVIAPYGILEMARTGLTALHRGAACIKDGSEEV